MYCNLAKYCCTPINSFWIIRQKVCLKLMFILEGSGDWSTTVNCRWTWQHYAIINPTSKMNRVDVRQDLYIVFRNWTKFILYSLFTIPFECCFSWPTRKIWCVCLHMTSRFYEIDIDSRNVAITFFYSGMKIQYAILRPFLLIVVLNWVLFSFFFYQCCCPSFFDLRTLITTLVYSNSCFIFIVYCSVCWHTWKTCCVCLHKTSRFYEIGIVVNDINLVLKFLDLCTKIQYFIWSVQNNVSVLFMKVFYFPTFVVFTIIVMLAPTHFSLAWG
jgi:hypothetical protein